MAEEMTYSEKYRAQLVAALEAIGQQIHDQATDLVGNVDLLTKMVLTVALPAGGDIFFPEIKVERQHIVPVADRVWMQK
jgi:hypothetical protein